MVLLNVVMTCFLLCASGAGSFANEYTPLKIAYSNKSNPALESATLAKSFDRKVDRLGDLEAGAADNAAEITTKTTESENPPTTAALQNNKNPAEAKAVLPVAEKIQSNVLSKIVFRWDEPVAAGLFKRAGYLWIVFDKAKEINIASLINKNSEYFLSGLQMPNRYYTILRLKLKKDINISTHKENNDWVIDFVNEKVLPEHSAKIGMKFSDLKGSKVILDSDTPLRPLRLIDPEVGDEVVILPYREENTGVKEVYKYVDFSFLETFQGAVINLISDKVLIDTTDTGISVTGHANIIDNATQTELSLLRDKDAKRKQSGSESSLLKFNIWHLEGDAEFTKYFKELEWQITQVDWSEKSKYRLALARFYIAHGMAAESLGVIRMLKEYDSQAAKGNDVKIIEATALYMMGRYEEAENVYNTMNTSLMNESNKNEVLFWRTAARINSSNEITLEQFITRSKSGKKNTDKENPLDSRGNSGSSQNTSLLLLRMIQNINPDFIDVDELKKIESTAQFVTGNYQDTIKKFEENDWYNSSDILQAEDSKLWFNKNNEESSEGPVLMVIPNANDFLQNYPDRLFNDFVLLALEDALKRKDMTKAEELQVLLRTEDRDVQKNSIEFLRGLYYAKSDEEDKAVKIWQNLIKESSDPYNRTRAQFALTVLQLEKKQIDIKQAIENMNSVRILWRGGQLEFHILSLLGEFYMSNKQPIEAFRVWKEAVTTFPNTEESFAIAKAMSANFIKFYAQGGADKIPKVDAISLYYEFRELTPIGRLGDEMISNLVDRLIDVDLLDHAAALLAHQIRFRLIHEERDAAAIKLIKINLINKDPQKALDTIDATENENINENTKTIRRYLRASAMLELGKNNKVLALLREDESATASFIRADVYWRGDVWRKVIDELEVPFKDIRASERSLTNEETTQLIKLAISYALVDRYKRLEVLYEDFVDLIEDQDKKNLLTFIATNKGPVDYKNFYQTVEYKYLEDFLNSYTKTNTEAGNG